MPIAYSAPLFGSVYVGETFGCTLSANNEIHDDDNDRLLTSVRIVAEMQHLVGRGTRVRASQ
jgi:Protein of unknown function (DUF974).